MSPSIDSFWKGLMAGDLCLDLSIIHPLQRYHSFVISDCSLDKGVIIVWGNHRCALLSSSLCSRRFTVSSEQQAQGSNRFSGLSVSPRRYLSEKRHFKNKEKKWRRASPSFNFSPSSFSSFYNYPCPPALLDAPMTKGIYKSFFLSGSS